MWLTGTLTHFRAVPLAILLSIVTITSDVSHDHLVPALNAVSPFSPRDICVPRTAVLPRFRGRQLDEEAKPRVRSLICWTSRPQKRQDGACVDLDRPTRPSRTARIADVHWIQDLGYAAAQLTAHLRPHLRGTSWPPPFAVHKLLRQISDPSSSSSSSKSKSKSGTHGVIDFGQLPVPSTLLLPAALRPAAVCEPT